MAHQRIRHQKGFSLVEAVIAMGLLVGAGAVTRNGLSDRSNARSAIRQMQDIENVRKYVNYNMSCEKTIPNPAPAACSSASNPWIEVKNFDGSTLINQASTSGFTMLGADIALRAKCIGQRVIIESARGTISQGGSLEFARNPLTKKLVEFSDINREIPLMCELALATPPPIDTPPIDTPPIDTPPVDTPPVEAPPAAIACNSARMSTVGEDGSWVNQGGNNQGVYGVGGQTFRYLNRHFQANFKNMPNYLPINTVFFVINGNAPFWTITTRQQAPARCHPPITLNGADHTTAGGYAFGLTDAICKSAFQKYDDGYLGWNGLDVTVNFQPLNASQVATGAPCVLKFHMSSPIVLHFGEEELPMLSSINPKRRFDLDGDGRPESIGGLLPPSGLLVLDLNQNHMIDNGSELFGDSTWLPDGTRAANGYLALAQHDEDASGVIDQDDAIFDALQVWFDINHNGISEVNELKSLEHLGVTGISLDYEVRATKDDDLPVLSGAVPLTGRFFGPTVCPTNGCQSFDVYFASSNSDETHLHR